MTHRGPFQPLLFCDSVILSVQENTDNFYPSLPTRTNIQILERAAACKIPDLEQLLDFGYHQWLVLKASGLLHRPGVTVKPASRLPLTPSRY